MESHEDSERGGKERELPLGLSGASGIGRSRNGCHWRHERARRC